MQPIEIIIVIAAVAVVAAVVIGRIVCKKRGGTGCGCDCADCGHCSACRGGRSPQKDVENK